MPSWPVAAASPCWAARRPDSPLKRRVVDADSTPYTETEEREVKPIWYASTHQAISALHSIVCIPTRYTENVPPIEDWDQFELQEYDSRGNIPELPQPSKWIRTGPVWRPDEAANEAAVSFLRGLWPFKDSWIQAGDRLQCFRAELQGGPHREVLARIITEALARIR